MRQVIAAEAFLANLPFFRGLGQTALHRLAAGTTRHKVRRGAHIFREGEMPTGLHAVVYGRVKLASHDAAGREVRADIVDAGQTFGEAMLFLDRPYLVTATATTDALVLHAIAINVALGAGDVGEIIALLAGKLCRLPLQSEHFGLGRIALLIELDSAVKLVIR